MITVLLLLSICAFLACLASIAKSDMVPWWVSVILLCLIELLRTLPLGR